MYLSRLVLDPRSRRAQKECGYPYEMHRSIMNAFSENLPADERVLFRTETDRRTGVITVLVQSVYAPDWRWLDEVDRYLLDIAEANPWVKEFDPAFSRGQQLIFRLRANPTVKRDGKRHALFREEEQMEWLQRKAQSSGFEIDAVRAQSLGYVQGKTREQHSLRLFAIQYDGILVVAEPDALLASVYNGIGPGKGLGFGLLSLAPA